VSLARRIVAWIIALLLALYVVGTFRLGIALVRSHGGGQPLSAVIAGLYVRFLVMGILLIVLVRVGKVSSAPPDESAKAAGQDPRVLK